MAKFRENRPTDLEDLAIIKKERIKNCCKQGLPGTTVPGGLINYCLSERYCYVIGSNVVTGF